MALEDLVINTYCLVDDYLKEANLTQLRKRGEAPALYDVEVITMEIVGEYLSHGSDKRIWAYFKSTGVTFFLKSDVVRLCKIMRELK